MSNKRKRKRKRSGAGAGASRVGADEALSTLIGQFADPLVFLRELVQNSLDAASTQIDVEFDWADGLTTVTVTDNGEGMNEEIIDNYLLTLFSSTKEDDLTKIGKFGVGFVSIFAIEPDLVVLETGQAGESWRILFHPDKSFEKLRIDEPMEGTSIALHKRMAKKEFADIEKRGAATVRYWCKYAEAEVSANGELIGEELGLAADLVVEHHEPGTSLVVGFPPVREPNSKSWRDAADGEAAAAVEPLVGFYNRGLTLIEAAQLPDDKSPDLAGVSMRVKSRYLEHTLTRDNVRADENYYKALELVRGQIGQRLRPALVGHLEALARHYSGGESEGAPPPGPNLPTSLLYARLPAMQLHQRAADAAIIPTTDGEPLSLSQLGRQRSPVDGIPVAPRKSPLTALFARDGTRVALGSGGVREHLRACGFEVSPINALFYTAAAVDPGPADKLLAVLQELLDKARAKIEKVCFGDLDYPGSPVNGRLYVRQERAFGLTRMGEDDKASWLGGARELVINWSHPLVVKCIKLAGQRPALAMHLLAQGIAIEEGIPAKRRVDVGRVAVAWQRARSAKGSAS